MGKTEAYVIIGLLAAIAFFQFQNTQKLNAVAKQFGVTQ